MANLNVSTSRFVSLFLQSIEDVDYFSDLDKLYETCMAVAVTKEQASTVLFDPRQAETRHVG